MKCTKIHSLRQEHGDAHQFIPQIPIPACITSLGLEHRTQSFQSKCYLPRPHELTIKKGSPRSCHTSKRVLQVHIDEFKSHQSASKLIKKTTPVGVFPCRLCSQQASFSMARMAKDDASGTHQKPHGHWILQYIVDSRIMADPNTSGKDVIKFSGHSSIFWG